jgi:ankyrin repeat protein
MRTSSITIVVSLALATGAFGADSKRDALWAAVRAGDVKAVEKAVNDGADVNARNEYGVTALWLAAGKEKLDVVEFLVKKGADVTHGTTSGIKPRLATPSLAAASKP